MTSIARTSARALAVLALSLLPLAATAQTSVTVAGNLQTALGCSTDWDPPCPDTMLAYDQEDTVWERSFSVPAGNWEYKAALNGSWTENYGLHAAPGGANVPLTLASAAPVKFYYDPRTHWITSSRNAVIATAPGNYQSELGCAGDWDPGCLRSWLEDPDGDGVYTFSTSSLPAGSYETKVAIAESWNENYGAGGVQNGPNIPFVVSSDCEPVLFSYDSATHLLTVTVGGAPPQPASVTIAGDLQSELGCAGDWDPSCGATMLSLDPTDGVWQRTFTVPAGSWQYKAALNGSWTENYGANAQPGGSNIALSLAQAASVKFYFDPATHWITSSANAIIATAPGNFQSALGCPGDWQPDCLRSWLQDPDGDGIYTFTTSALPAGTYEAKVAIDESWALNYGAGGVRDGANVSFTVPAACAPVTFSWDSASHVLTISVGGVKPGNLALARAHWLSRNTIAWPIAVQPGEVFRLHADPAGGLALSDDGVSGGVAFDLSVLPGGLPPDLAARFPHLAGATALTVPDSAVAIARDLLRGDLAVSASLNGVRADATGLQLPGVLDDLYATGPGSAYDARLGICFAGGAPTLRVWAPTARSVKLHLFDGPGAAATETVVPMTLDATGTATGIWTAIGTPAWKGLYYLYEVEVYVRSEKGIVKHLVTDPYSLSLSTNSRRSQIVDLADPALAPTGWASAEKPPLRAPTDISIYELHVRDFSANDAAVPKDLKGTFLAFTLDTPGTRHLKRLAAAGLSHVHLLPAFDFATVDEDRSTWLDPACDLASFPPNSAEQAACVALVRSADGFNWGYDPLHYTVPEGSYASDPDGAARIREFRAMVKALNGDGLRVVMDVVYNHTNASGESPNSVLDKVVPGYYHRLNADGRVETSTCCQNTASEHAMMEKLMVDSVVTWARDYKVDGFRFDLMGHHMKSNMLKVRAALDALTKARDGVDGKAVYVYGEGWDFGEVANGARGVNATQLNMAGTGIGTFTDRLRDRVRGGSPFSDRRDQGFATGLGLDASDCELQAPSPADPEAQLLAYSDVVRLGMAGNLAAFRLEAASGNPLDGWQFDYNGQPAGYAGVPADTINYVSAHDNETWFDAVQTKLPCGATLQERVRAHNLGVSIVALSQGIPFFLAGDELLRSKSGDGNSYDSGDWFNRLDFTGQTSAWGSGLPIGWNASPDFLAPLLAKASIKPGPAEIAAAQAHFEEMLTIRRSTSLLRLRTAQEVLGQVRFLNVGPAQIPGLVVMRIVGGPGTQGPYHQVVALVNARPSAVTFAAPELRDRALRLHPAQARSADPLVRTAAFDCGTGTFTIPPRTAAVFVATDAQGKAASCRD